MQPSGSITVISVIGRSGSGKTTLLEKLIPELKRRGYRVGTIKHHAHPGIEIDRPGKDTWRHAHAGSDHVVIAAPDRLVSIRNLNRELELEEISAQMEDVDIILTEGFSRASTPKIEVVRSGRSVEPLEVTERIAFATDINLLNPEPQFNLDDAHGLADMIENQFFEKKHLTFT
jgi:molybdopterin-guanine dinucleotide biosynthesis protein MobB